MQHGQPTPGFMRSGERPAHRRPGTRSDVPGSYCSLAQSHASAKSHLKTRDWLREDGKRRHVPTRAEWNGTRKVSQPHGVK